MNQSGRVSSFTIRSILGSAAERALSASPDYSSGEEDENCATDCFCKLHQNICTNAVIKPGLEEKEHRSLNCIKNNKDINDGPCGQRSPSPREDKQPDCLSEKASNDATKKKTRTVFSRSQVFQLESAFDAKRYLSSAERACLASSLRLSETQVKTWFQNRRNKWKRQLAADLEAAHMAHATPAAARTLVGMPLAGFGLPVPRSAAFPMYYPGSNMPAFPLYSLYTNVDC